MVSVSSDIGEGDLRYQPYLCARLMSAVVLLVRENRHAESINIRKQVKLLVPNVLCDAVLLHIPD